MPMISHISMLCKYEYDKLYLIHSILEVYSNWYLYLHFCPSHLQLMTSMMITKIFLALWTETSTARQVSHPYLWNLFIYFGDFTHIPGYFYGYLAFSDHQQTSGCLCHTALLWTQRWSGIKSTLGNQHSFLKC